MRGRLISWIRDTSARASMDLAAWTARPRAFMIRIGVKR